MKYTSEMMQDLLQCAHDPEFFIKEFLGINKVPEGMIEWEGSVVQDDTIQREIICAYALWHMIFHPRRTVLFVSKSQEARRVTSETVHDMYDERLPDWMKPKFRSKSITRFELENGAKILFEIASPNTGRGHSIATLILDDYNAYKPGMKYELLQSLWPTMTVIASTTIIIGKEERLDK